MVKDLVYPIYPRTPSIFERLALKTRWSVGFCPVCGKLTAMLKWGENFRETGICVSCHSTNRQRQLAYLLCACYTDDPQKSVSSLKELQKHSDLAIYNTESSGSLHRYLSPMPHYICSEYLGMEYKPGEMTKGVRHENLMQLSFEDNCFDIILSSDVFEHIPLAYRGHREVFRVLKPGGRHIFTVPFHQTLYFDEVLAEWDGGQPKLLKPPIYHHDPLSPQGILVYTIFSLQMLLKLNELGFTTHMYLLYHPRLGILGPNGIVFEAIKNN